MRLPRHFPKRNIPALTALLDPATSFVVRRRGSTDEFLTAQTDDQFISFSYEAVLRRTRAVRALEYRDYGAFAARLGVFEHYEVPFLLGLAHEAIAETIAPSMALPFLDPGVPEGTPYRYWQRSPLRDYAVRATLRAPVERGSLGLFVARLWDDGSRELVLDPEVPNPDPEASSVGRP